MFKKLILPFISAVLSTALIASLLSTQFVVAGLQEVGIDIGLMTRLSLTLSDFAVIKLLGIIIAISFLIGFLVAKLGHRQFGGTRLYWFIVAGATAWLCALLLMSYQLQLMPLAGARTNFGLLLQAMAGAIGGFLFARLSADNHLIKET